MAPGPGTYKLKDSCQVREPKHIGATYRSKVDRDFEKHIIGKSNPGIGEYDLTKFNSLGGHTLEGGGAPNNFTICYKDISAGLGINMKPRFGTTQANSK